MFRLHSDLYGMRGIGFKFVEGNINPCCCGRSTSVPTNRQAPDKGPQGGNVSDDSKVLDLKGYVMCPLHKRGEEVV